jgi:hypothetical protein
MLTPEELQKIVDQCKTGVFEPELLDEMWKGIISFLIIQFYGVRILEMAVNWPDDMPTLDPQKEIDLGVVLNRAEKTLFNLWKVVQSELAFRPPAERWMYEESHRSNDALRQIFWSMIQDRHAVAHGHVCGIRQGWRLVGMKKEEDSVKPSSSMS